MRGLADTSGIHDATSRRVFLDRDIVRRNQTLEMELKFASNFSPLEMRAARCPLFGVRFGRIFSLAFLSFSPVAVFRGFDSNSRNGVRFATSQEASEIVAPEALHSHATFLNIRRDSSCEGERCMKDTVHPIRHPSVHPQIFGRAQNRRSCASHDDQFGRGQNTGLGWSDPTFVHVFVPKVTRGVAPAQLRGDRAEYFVRAAFHSREPQ
jgi:hypothetical protein